jgi:hypothetical protein
VERCVKSLAPPIESNVGDEVAGHVEVDYETELRRVIDERRAGIDRPEHVTTIAGAVYTEWLSVERFMETQGIHTVILRQLQHDVRALDRKLGALDHKADQLDRRVGALDHKVDALDRRMSEGFDRMERLLVEAVGRQPERRG